MKIAVIGSGPAGFYATNALLSKFPFSKVDIIEKLPVPFGLVRYGVAPDHPSTRNVTTQFSRLMHEHTARVSFNGNIEIQFPDTGGFNSDRSSWKSNNTNVNVIPFEQLRELYHLVVLATGASHPRQLGNDITRESKNNCAFSAHDFVLWINGHPDLHGEGGRKHIADRMVQVLRNASDCTVIGAGNVALDIARNLLRPHSVVPMPDIGSDDNDKGKRQTGQYSKKISSDSDSDDVVHDIGVCLSALTVMHETKIDNVNVIARRAPHHAAWTTAALRELLNKLPGIVTRCDRAMLESSMAVTKDRKTKRMLDVLTRNTVDTNDESDNNLKTLHLMFEHTLSSIHNNNGHHDDRTIQGKEATLLAVFTNGKSIHTDAAFLSLGYVSPTTIPQTDATSNGAHDEKGCLTRAVGWANGNARGIIGDNKWDAETVVAGLGEGDVAQGQGDRPGLEQAEGIDKDTVVSWAGWERIREEEAKRGLELTGLGRRSVRLETVSEMLRVANGQSGVFGG